MLADNKLALNAGWDLEMLSVEIGELGEAGFDLNLTGFAEFELGELFAERTQGRPLATPLHGDDDIDTLVAAVSDFGPAYSCVAPPGGRPPTEIRKSCRVRKCTC